MNEWIDDLINKVDLVVDAEQRQKLVAFIRENASILTAVGQDAFKAIVALVSKGQDEEARKSLIAYLGTWELIEQANQHADAVEAIAVIRDKRNAFINGLLLLLVKEVAKKLILLLV